QRLAVDEDERVLVWMGETAVTTPPASRHASALDTNQARAPLAYTPPHLAARMEQMAMPGSILITAAVLGLAEGYITVQPLGPVQVKGLQEPVTVYEVTGAGSVRTRLQAAAARGLTRFVGRDTELDALTQALARAGA